MVRVSLCHSHLNKAPSFSRPMDLHSYASSALCSSRPRPLSPLPLQTQSPPLSSSLKISDPSTSRTKHLQIHAPPDPYTSRPMHLQTYATPEPSSSRSMHLQTHAPPDPCTSRPMHLQNPAPPDQSTFRPLNLQTHAPPDPCTFKTSFL